MVDVLDGAASLLAACATRLVKHHAAVITTRHPLVSMLDLRWLSSRLGLLLFGILGVTASVASLRPGVHHLDFFETSAHHSIIRVLIRANVGGKRRSTVSSYENS